MYLPLINTAQVILLVVSLKTDQEPPTQASLQKGEVRIKYTWESHSISY